eukprot:TRINITY_DN1129_c0_g3_i2.p1 TRINITY_DN1129_c0_g3~~TRINITY_DN1129_c0_g3_i2.p1  ORF type:complete len:251 (+),score=56.84 TRINITY_DN1129_c0_g3_i2:348-1100(+)
MDHNKDGTLSYAEFQQAVEGMNLGLSKEQITYFALSLDQDNDGTVSYNEFLSRFKMKFRKPLGFLSQEEAAEVEKLVDELGELLYSRSMTLQEAFSSFDKDNSGYITVDELSIALRETLGLHLTPFQNRYLLDILDVDADHRISFDEFRNAIEPVDVKHATGSLGGLAEKLFANRSSLRAAFFFLDRDASGSISRTELEEGMRLLNNELSVSFSATEIESLMDALDTNKDGEISYEEFISSISSVAIHKD